MLDITQNQRAKTDPSILWIPFTSNKVMVYFKLNTDLLKNRFSHKFNRRFISEQTYDRSSVGSRMVAERLFRSIQYGPYSSDLGHSTPISTGGLYSCILVFFAQKNILEEIDEHFHRILKYGTFSDIFNSTDIFDAEYNHYAAPIFWLFIFSSKCHFEFELST